MRRAPAVAGQFYPLDAEALREEVQGLLQPGRERLKAIGAMAPHAGYMYSGRTAGLLYSSIEIPPTVLLLGPNHTGLGPRASIMSQGQWEVPTGTAEIDQELAQALLREAPLLEQDTAAHLYEHSLEVQLPFLLELNPRVRIVPVVLMEATLEELQALGEAIARAIRASGREALVIASSDMSHYVPHEVAQRKDHLALQRLLALEPQGLYQVVKAERISMCGYLPATAMLWAARALGAREARLLAYSTSAEASGDYSQVVGYAAVVLLR
jgi:hypothetical protein